MELGHKEVISIFQSNFNYPIVDTKLGKGVIMPPNEAFIFCNITGAGYLENPIYPYTPKGLLKIFYNAFDYKFVTGIFENSRLNHTPYFISKLKPHIFKGDKIIIPVEFESEQELVGKLENYIEEEKNTTDYIILRIEKRKKGNGMEAFMEFLVTSYFKNIGYIVENQIPLAYSLGSPDFGGYKLRETFESINNNFIFNSTGLHLIELSMLRLGLEKKILKSESSDLAIVGEAKTSTPNMKGQLIKYLDSGLFNMGFEIHPSKEKPILDTFGLFGIDPLTYKIRFTPPSNSYTVKNKIYSRKGYYEWLANYVKFHLIANFTNDELIEYYQKITKSANLNQAELVSFVCNLNTNELLIEILKLK